MPRAVRGSHRGAYSDESFDGDVGGSRPPHLGRARERAAARHAHDGLETCMAERVQAALIVGLHCTGAARARPPATRRGRQKPSSASVVDPSQPVSGDQVGRVRLDSVPGWNRNARDEASSLPPSADARPHRTHGLRRWPCWGYRPCSGVRKASVGVVRAWRVTVFGVLARRSARLLDGSTRDMPLASPTAAVVLSAVPWRSVRAHRGQRHLPGWYWSATTGGHVGYESRRELARLLRRISIRRLWGSRRSRSWCPM